MVSRLKSRIGICFFCEPVRIQKNIDRVWLGHRLGPAKCQRHHTGATTW